MRIIERNAGVGNHRTIERDFAFKLASAADESGVFEGYASTFGNEDSYGDTIRKGAFTKGLAKLAANGQKVKMLWNHDRQQPIGVFTAASEDNSGLYVKGQLTKGVQKADEVLLLMRAGAIDSMSIGGYVVKEIYDNKTAKSELLEIDLSEISPVTFPANTQARITAVKSIEGYDKLSELERHLRDVGGFSATEAKAIIAKARNIAPTRRDGGDDEIARLLREAVNIIK